MANRTDPVPAADLPAGPPIPRPQQILERARADLSRMARRSPEPDAEAPAITVVEDASAVAARIDLLRGRLAKAREDAVSALLFLSDAQQDCDALSESCAAVGWTMMAEGVALLSAALRRALPSESRHLALVGLLIDALYALRRAEMQPNMAAAGHDLLRGLRLAIARELGASVS